MAGHHGAHTVDTASLVSSHQVEGGDQSQLHTSRTWGYLGHAGVLRDSYGRQGGVGVGNNWQSCCFGLVGGFLFGCFLVNVWEGLDLVVNVGFSNIWKSKFLEILFDIFIFRNLQ